MNTTSYELAKQAFVEVKLLQDYDTQFALGILLMYAKQDRLSELTDLLIVQSCRNGTFQHYNASESRLVYEVIGEDRNEQLLGDVEKVKKMI